MVPSGHGGIGLRVNPSSGCELDTRASEAPPGAFERYVDLGQRGFLPLEFGAFTEDIIEVDVERLSGIGTGHATASNRWDRKGGWVGRAPTLKGTVDRYMVTCRWTANRNERREHSVEIEPLDGLRNPRR